MALYWSRKSISEFADVLPAMGNDSGPLPTTDFHGRSVTGMECSCI